MADSVYRVTELVGTSSQSWEAAANCQNRSMKGTLCPYWPKHVENRDRYVPFVLLRLRFAGA